MGGTALQTQAVTRAVTFLLRRREAVLNCVVLLGPPCLLAPSLALVKAAVGAPCMSERTEFRSGRHRTLPLFFTQPLVLYFFVFQRAVYLKTTAREGPGRSHSLARSLLACWRQRLQRFGAG